MPQEKHVPRVLVVEDSPTQAQQLTFILEDAGFAVETAPDADRAVACLGEAPFNLVVSDLLLPGASGFDLCRRIKADARYQPAARGCAHQPGGSGQCLARPGGGCRRLHDQGSAG